MHDRFRCIEIRHTKYKKKINRNRSHGFTSKMIQHSMAWLLVVEASATRQHTLPRAAMLETQPKTPTSDINHNFCVQYDYFSLNLLAKAKWFCGVICHCPSTSWTNKNCITNRTEISLNLFR